MEKYKIFKIQKEQKDSLEQLGTKEKFWFMNENKKTLFKIGRANTGEDWAEVIVAEICNILSLPHAKYDFAEYEDSSGTITENFVPDNGRLILGNELLARVLKDVKYDSYQKYGLKEYKLSTILALLKDKSINIPRDFSYDGIHSAFDVFVGYIMLDCLISNPDRHHENWGIIFYDDKIYLCPTYDHASGLGCRASDDEKKRRLATKDVGYMVSSFVKKAKTPFYDKKDGKKLSTIEAFNLCCRKNQESCIYWLNKLKNFNIEELRPIFNKIPNGLISEVSIEFALEILKENKKRLLDNKEFENEQ